MALLIFANGVLDEVEWIRPYLTHATAVWAADGGSRHLFRLNYLPNRVIGDQDSLSSDLKRWLIANQVLFDHYPPEKDETDLELALLKASEQADPEIWLFGLLGGRLDQMLANIFLLTNPVLANKTVQLITPSERAWLVRDRIEISGQIGDLVSLIPLAGDAEGVTTSGLAWQLHAETVHVGQARGISNRLSRKTATITVQDGLLLCVHTHNEL